MRKHLVQSTLPILAILLAVAIFFRFHQIGQVPPGLFPDEATHALDALEVLRGQITIYSPDEGSTGVLWRYLLALNFALFGPSILSLRAFASAVGVASIGMAYLVVRELSLAPPAPRSAAKCPEWGAQPARAFPQPSRDGGHFPSPTAWRENIAFLAALWLAVSYWHVDLSRTAFSAVLMLLIQDATFFCLWRALHSGRRHWFVLFGLGAGLLVYNYLPGKLVPAMLLLFLLLQWVVTQRDALVAKYRRSFVVAGGIALVVAMPFILFAIFNYQDLLARAAVPTAGAVAPVSPLQGMIGNLAAFGLWPTPWLSGAWNTLFLGPILTLCFVVGVGVSLGRLRQPNYLFLLVWWLVMLLPGVLAPEGAIPHTRRAIGIATVTFALASLGLATLVSVLFGLVRRGQSIVITDPVKTGHLMARGSLILALGLGLGLAARVGANTFFRYFVQWGPSEAARLTYHVYDLELADLMARQSGAETVYLLPLDSSAGIVNPLLDSITFVYRGQASYDFLPDDEGTMAERLARLTAGKQVVRLLRWKVTKHTGADPKGVAHYYLEKWGRRVGTESYTYFDMDIYQLENTPADAFTPAELTPLVVSYEEQLALTGHRFGDASGLAADEPAAEAGGLLWTELAWRKTGEFSTNYQVAVWLEDEAGHVVGQVDKPLLNNLWHQGTGKWPAGADERDYYLVPVDPATPPGTYRLKVIVYAGDGNGRRLAPRLPGIGADLGATLGEVAIYHPLEPVDAAMLPIPQRLGLDLGDGLHLLGYDPGFAGSLQPGDRATLKLWWQARGSPSRDLAVLVGIGQGDQAELLGGASYPTREWAPGTVVKTFVDLRLPADVETGEYNLGLRLVDREQDTALADWVLGKLQVTGRVRSFEIPPMGHPVHVDFGEQVTLLGYDLDLSQTGEGGPVQLTIYWQAKQEMGTAYKVFVHLLNETGQIVTQVDREPQAGAAPTTGWVAGEVVADELEIPITEGLTQVRSIALGLYDPATGERLSVLDAQGSVIGDSVTLAVP